MQQTSNHDVSPTNKPPSPPPMPLSSFALPNPRSFLKSPAPDRRGASPSSENRPPTTALQRVRQIESLMSANYQVEFFLFLFLFLPLFFFFFNSERVFGFILLNRNLMTVE